MDNLIYAFLAHFIVPPLSKEQLETYGCLLPRLRKKQSVVILSCEPGNPQVEEGWRVVAWPGAGKIEGNEEKDERNI